MKRSSSSLVWFLAGLGMGLVLARGLLALRMQTTQTSLSPDERHRARILDRPFMWVDRNFEVRVERMDDHRETTIFRSPDEDPRPGRERIARSEDGKRFVVFGPGFVVRDRPRSREEDVLYLMYDVDSGKLWCNSDQQTAFPPFTCKDLPPMRWGGPCGPAR
jgi:hypothetical protein